MRRLSLALCASLATIAFALPAAAEDAPATPPPTTATATATPTAKSIEENNRDLLGKGSWIIGAERVFGFSLTTMKPAGGDATKITQYGILWSNSTSVYQIPRMAIDYVAFDQVTFGGALGIAHSSIDIPNAGSTGTTNWILAPRAGYIFGGKGLLSFWARAGFSVWSTSNETSQWGLALNIEPEILISPYKHLGIYLGGVADIGLTGKQSISVNGQDQSLGYNVNNFGINSGLRAWF